MIILKTNFPRYLILILLFIEKGSTFEIGHLFFSPGIKICYEFGGKPGFAFGPEISAGVWGYLLSGIVIGKQWHLFGKRSTSYIEAEIGHPLFGIAAGIETISDIPSWKGRLRLFTGCFGYLSLKFTDSKFPNELGLVGKLPVLPLMISFSK